MSFHSPEHSLWSYKHEQLNVLAVRDLSLMFGYIDGTGDWVDGVFTALMKKANQQLAGHKISTWISLDGPLHDGWCCKLRSLIESSKVTETFSLVDQLKHFCRANAKGGRWR